jgi:DNA-binding NarL/FixJ family response regulator
MIAVELGISPKTLDIHRANLLRKMNIKSVLRLTQIVDLLRVADAFPGLAATREGEMRFPK